VTGVPEPALAAAVCGTALDHIQKVHDAAVRAHDKWLEDVGKK
jgi:hypothetical protein